MLPVSRPRRSRPASHQGRPALFLLRPEVGERKFPETYGSSIDGAIILGRLLADGGRVPRSGEVDRPGSQGTAQDEAPDELARVARRNRVVHLHDPDTVVLAHLESHQDFRASRACRMGAAMAVDLPLRAGDLGDPTVVERLVRATLRSQIRVTFPAPPYFEFNAIDDPWLTGNLACIAAAERALPGRRQTVFVRGSLMALMSGALAAAAPRYAAARPTGAMLLLGVSGLHPEQSSAEELAAYLDAIRAYDESGFDVIADRVDHLGPAAVARGAVGVAGGSRIYRVIPPTPFWENEWSVKIRLKCAVPIRGDRMLQTEARRRRGRGSIPACPVADCRALEEKAPNGVIREHFGHLTQIELADARAHGLEWVARRYEASPLAGVRRLGVAVRLAMRRVQEA